MRLFLPPLLGAVLVLCACQESHTDGKGDTTGDDTSSDSTAVVRDTLRPGSPQFPEMLEQKQWTLASYVYAGRTEEPIKEQAPTLSLNAGKIAGSTGCNQYSGSIDPKEDGTIVIGGIMRTKKACRELMDQETAFINLLEGAQTYRVNEVFLEMDCKDGHLSFHNQNFSMGEIGRKDR